MFGIVKNNNVIKLLNNYESFEVGGVQYPPDWIAKTTSQEQLAIGIYPVFEFSKPNKKFFNITSNTTFIPANNRIEIYYTSTNKPLESLKLLAIKEIKQKAANKLQITDWKVIRALETNNNLSSSITSLRANIRTAVNVFENSIVACNTVVQLSNIVNNFNFPEQLDDI